MNRVFKSKKELEELGLRYVPEEKRLYKWLSERYYNEDGKLVTRKIWRSINQFITINGYIAYVTSVKGKGRFIFLQHNLEWIYAHPDKEIPEGYVIHHIDENKLNNDPSNLQAISFSENLKRSPGRKKECQNWLNNPEVIAKREGTKAMKRALKKSKQLIDELKTIFKD